MNSKEKTRSLGIAWLLAGLLLLGQWSALAHELDLESHPAGHVCEWCVAHAGLDHMVVGAAVPALDASSTQPLPANARPGIRPFPPTYYPARAPPLLRSC